MRGVEASKIGSDQAAQPEASTGVRAYGVCCHDDTTYCSRCDLLIGLDGLHVLRVDGVGGLRVVVESPPTVKGESVRREGC